MEQYLLTITFRYKDIPRNHLYSEHHEKCITIGVYNDFDEACKNGNIVLEKLENKFPLHVFPSGEKAKKERFSKNGGPFGYKNDLVSNLAYLKTPFQFSAKIVTLKYDNIDNVVDDIVLAKKRYDEYEKKNKEY